MSFLNNLDSFFRSTPSTEEERQIADLAKKLKVAGTSEALRVFALARHVEKEYGLPQDSVVSLVMSSGRWRSGLPPKDAEALSLSRDLLISGNHFPQARHTYGGADPGDLSAALESVGRAARRVLVVQVLKHLVARSRATGGTPRQTADRLLGLITSSPRLFADSDLIYRMISIVAR